MNVKHGLKIQVEASEIYRLSSMLTMCANALGENSNGIRSDLWDISLKLDVLLEGTGFIINEVKNENS